MTDEQILKIIPKHFVEVIAEKNVSTGLYVAKNETLISFARAILDSQNVEDPLDMYKSQEHRYSDPQ